MKSISTDARRGRLLASCAAFALGLGLTGAAHAQLSTATVNGRVSENAAVQAGAKVVATQAGTGFVTRATSDQTGAYVLPGLRPGRYQITATAPDGRSVSETLDVQVGQSATLDLAVAPPAAAVSELVVTGAPTHARETKTSEVATNITIQQIDNLPQADRNFLNFAQLAPGIRLSTNPLRKTFSGGANGSPNGDSLASSQTNVFIDGVSLKSNVQQGGLVGQDSSRGNPFSQLAVQEFRVSTQNFKAEYEDAGTSVITAVTKSGSNEFHGELFGTFENQNMMATDAITKRNGLSKPPVREEQYGVSLGGPIIQDKLFFFGSYEANDQVRSGQVVAQGDAARQAQLPFPVSQFTGTFASPFHEDLFFGKLTWRVSDDNTLEVSANYRKEHEITGFGNQGGGSNVGFEQAQNNRNTVFTLQAKDTWQGSNWLNELTADLLTSEFNPSIANPNLPGRNFFGVIEVGGFSTDQDVRERDITLRDNLTFTGFDWHGAHVVKVGAKVSIDQFKVENGQNTNPQFNFDINPALNESFAQPFEAIFGTGVPHMNANDTQFGMFIQDDWKPTAQLTVNLGLRWDYESNANDENFVTPPDAVAALRGLEATLSTQPGNFFHANDYISTGSNRKAYLGEFQPRIGVSYDLFNDQRTVLFAGYGRYYDRTLFRNAAEENLFRQFTLRSFEFSPDGLPRNGQPTIQFQPQFLTAAGLNALIASNQAPNGELRVLRNDQKPPFTDQFSVGVRQRVGDWNTSATLSEELGRDDIGYFPANRTVARNAGGFLDFIPVPGFGNVVASSNARQTKYTALYLYAEKPYTEESRWGATLAYTYAHSKQKGYTFNFDFPNIATDPFYPNDADVRHQFVGTGTVGLPWGIRASTVVTLTSGAPYSVTDASRGFGDTGNGNMLRIGDFAHAGMFQQVDLSFAKDIQVISGQKIELDANIFNVFNHSNLGCNDGFKPPLPDTNANFGNPGCTVGPPLTVQVGAKYKF
ncbi:MAG TPA: TonB-dependent receptor [Phenylobacterium sp.]|jgi:hypothetical protein|nr:TonB-dependent receptor [Phenylobacterium sp.]